MDDSAVMSFLRTSDQKNTDLTLTPTSFIRWDMKVEVTGMCVEFEHRKLNLSSNWYWHVLPVLFIAVHR
jgi:hypothetical protein